MGDRQGNGEVDRAVQLPQASKNIEMIDGNCNKQNRGPTFGLSPVAHRARRGAQHDPDLLHAISGVPRDPNPSVTATRAWPAPIPLVPEVSKEPAVVRHAAAVPLVIKVRMIQ